MSKEELRKKAIELRRYLLGAGHEITITLAEKLVSMGLTSPVHTDLFKAGKFYGVRH